MKVKMDTQLMDLDDNPLTEKVASGEKNVLGQDILIDGPVFTLRMVAKNSMVAIFQDEQQLPGDDKLRRWELALKIKNSKDPVELTAEEISLVKKLIGKMYGPVITGQAWLLLESPALNS